MLLYRDVEDYVLLCNRCRDTASDGRGFIIPLGDEQIIEYLDVIENGCRSAVDQRLERILMFLIG
jgi:hypothetical protein